jgi:hypothetical protein
MAAFATGERLRAKMRGRTSRDASSTDARGGPGHTYASMERSGWTGDRGRERQRQGPERKPTSGDWPVWHRILDPVRSGKRQTTIAFHPRSVSGH